MADDPRDRAEQRTLLMPRSEAGSALKAGHRLEEFVIERVLGVGSHSVVYLARDTQLERRVAVKEYLPATLSARAPGGEVMPRLPRFRELFDSGLQSFMNEARLLGAFDHPSLLKVYRFWAGNGSAYMAMPFYEGVTLARWLADLGAAPSERWLRELADPLMAALEVMHAQNCFHRDVAPDNILMLYDRSGASYLEQTPRPLLLDFGAARRVIGDATQNLTAVLKSGYSPIEQYEGETSQRQGPWTDVYSLCAVLYQALSGRVPPSSIARVVRDEMVPAGQATRGPASAAFLAAVDAGLAVRPEDRPRTVAALRARMEGVVDLPANGPQDPVNAPTRSRRAGLRLAAPALALLLLIALAAFYFLRA